MIVQQRTLAKPVSFSGLGVHSGKTVHLTLKPAPVNHGIQFTRTDILESVPIPALFNRVVDTSLATVVGHQGCIVSTIEHLMATFNGMSIDNVLVELDAYEIPIMDGSARTFAEMIQSAGVAEQEGAKCFLVIQEPITIENGGKTVSVSPAPEFRITYTIEFPHPLIGKQTFDITVAPECFCREIAPARTFGFLQEVEYMKRFGLARGGSLDNAIVVGEERILNDDGLRFPDEFVRHKILDAIGDFALMGIPILGHVEIARSGHAFNHQFIQTLFDRKDAWETLTIHPFDARKDDSGLSCIVHAV